MANTNKANTNTNTNKEKKGEKIMNKSIVSNIEQATENMGKSLLELRNMMNHTSREKRGTASRKVSEQIAKVKADINTVNGFRAMAYYREHSLIDIVKAGKVIPAVVLKVEEKDGEFMVSTEEEIVYPTMQGMVKAGILKSDVVDTVDLLRRMIAYLKGNTLALTGDVENKKDIPNKNVAGLIESMGVPSVTKARNIMRVALKELTDGAFDKDVFTTVYKDFAEHMTRRGKEWGTRTMIGRATANDLILEYMYMSFNGKTAFKFVID